ncbi:MAG: pyruvate kinase [Lentimicrobium sp.]|jgi:pyruvate kinase|nr:pyruvate kinase [Lentimicrobium sp.]
MRKTKIIATLGPASAKEEILRDLMLAGVNVFRLNFSHGSHEIHDASITLINKLNDELGLHVATLADLSGPKIRTGEVTDDNMVLMPGEELTITIEKVPCAKGIISVNYEGFAQDVKADEDILIDDGKLLLKVISTNNTDQVKAKVVQGGVLSSRKGVNLPKTTLRLPSLSEKDLNDLDFILTRNIQWVALSFVRSAVDIEQLRKHIDNHSLKNPPRIIAKIEKPEAIQNAEAIIGVSDAIMIARGDLGVEIPQEQVPVVQKKFGSLCIAASKPVIIATQMMEGMITGLRPTRAEVSDVANSVLDGADALMLSGETSVGLYPVQTIETMSRIISDVENSDMRYQQVDLLEYQDRKISDAIITAASDLARKVNARAIIAMTHTGYSAFRLASQRTSADIFIFSNNRHLLKALSLVRGVTATPFARYHDTDTAMIDMRKSLISRGYIIKGDYIIYISSIPIGQAGKTNMLKLSVV